MTKGLFMLAAFLGALGIGLFWFGGFIKDLQETSHAVGKAECEAELAKKEVVVNEKAKEVQRNEQIVKANIYSKPNLNREQLLNKMRINHL